MTPYYLEIKKSIPFDKEDLINLSKLNILERIDSDNFVQKDNYSTDVLNPEFVCFLLDKGIRVRKVIVWHWLAKNPHIAHIDSGPDGDTVAAAINWTLTDNTRVNFYEPQETSHEVKYGNQDIPDWKTQNVGSYIPINVEGVDPAAVWCSEDRV